MVFIGAFAGVHGNHDYRTRRTAFVERPVKKAAAHMGAAYVATPTRRSGQTEDQAFMDFILLDSLEIFLDAVLE